MIYALHYAGLIPAGPGKSHQSIRDISLLAALPNMTIVQPATRRGRAPAALGGRARDRERRAAGSPSGPRRGGSSLPRYASDPGRGTVLREGSDALFSRTGP